MIRLVFCSCLLFSFFDLNDQLSVAPIFQSHMILQRDVPINVWGKAKKNQEITIIFNEEAFSAKAAENGEWKVVLPPTAAGPHCEMTIKTDEEIIEFTDIVMGDIWLCSGQSNMEMKVKECNEATQEIADANDVFIRHFNFPYSYSKIPEDEFEPANWDIASPETVGEFTAAGYYFAKELRKHTDVAIGLVNSTWGGSRIETWMSGEGLQLKNPKAELDAIIKKNEAQKNAELEDLKKYFPKLDSKEKGIILGNPVWVQEKLNESDWANVIAPANWDNFCCKAFDGIAWYRKTFDLTEEEAHRPIQLGLGMIDDNDSTWVNGKFVGNTEQWNAVRNYKIEPKFLKAGKNIIAIRVKDTGGGGGIHGSDSLLFVKTDTRKISLSGKWKFKLDAIFESIGLSNPHHLPMLCYNQMIYPLNRFPVKGVIWYQGESNAGSPQDATNYSNLFKNLINQWRSDRDDPDMPFLFVQLANFLAVPETPRESNWALLRESQSDALALKNTAQALAIDLGEAEDIHPKNKQDIGLRLALAARKIAYREDVFHKNPTFKSKEILGNKIILSFENIGKGLIIKNNEKEVKGFAIAGANKKFVWAKAELKNNQITAWNNRIPNPKYIQYAWAENPGELNLYNSENLPLTPFRCER